VEQRALLAFVISLIILIGYQALFIPAPQAPPAPEVTGAPSAPAPAQSSGSAPAEVADVAPPGGQPASPPAIRRPPSAPEKLATVETELFRAVFSSYGGRLKHFELKDYALTAGAESPPLDMVVSERVLPLGLYWRAGDGAVMGDRDVVYDVTVDRERVGAGERATVTLTAATDAGARLTKRLTIDGDSYVLGFEADVDAQGDPALGVAWARSAPREAAGRMGGTEGPAVLVGGELEAEQSYGLDEIVFHKGVVSWAGYADHYFLAAFYPDQPTELSFVADPSTPGSVEAQLWNEIADGRVAYNLFIGPKRIRMLGELGHALDRAVDLGWFTVVARPLLEFLFLIHRVTGNYGWAILLLTIAIRVVYYPINKKQVGAMKAMQRIQPELKKIQEKYKDDRERLNKEMIETYRRHKVNPMSGCWPMLLQIPVFIGLYNALMQAIELRHAPFFGWITDLSQPDRLGSLPIPFVEPPGIPVMTLLMGASMIIQQRMTPSMGDPTQQRMMMLMPVFFTVFFVNMPAGLVLYWFANNVLMIGQQYMTNRASA